MSVPIGFNFGLGSIPLLSNAQTRCICPENPTGAKGGAARAKPGDDEYCFPASRELGEGWKVHPFVNIKPGETMTIADIEGPGVIQHFFITLEAQAANEAVTLRIYWDGEETPSVECPLGSFFACGHGVKTKVASMPVAVNPTGAFNCYWPMPFRKSARITITSDWFEKINIVAYMITYALTDVPKEAGYFHAQFRRSQTRRDYPEHVILDGVTGQGHYVGTYLAWTQMSTGWWGEGEVKFFIDGDTKYPTICSTGTEDYFGGAWCYYGPDGREETFNAPYMGLPLSRRVDNEPPRHGMYRWHIMDPIHFQKDLKTTVQALGWWPDKKWQPLTDDIASVAYWYQTLPHAPFPKYPTMNERFPR